MRPAFLPLSISEIYTGRTGSWFNTSLTYNLDEEGRLGLTAAYKRGSDEVTNAAFDLYKLTLSAKLCTEVFSKTALDIALFFQTAARSYKIAINLRWPQSPCN